MSNDLVELVARTIHDHWQNAPGPHARPWDGEKGTCTKLPAQAEDFRHKARAVLQALQQHGMKLLPHEPTVHMLVQADGLTDLVVGDGGDRTDRHAELRLAYRIMYESYDQKS